MTAPEPRSRLRRAARTLAEVFYGLAFHEQVRALVRQRGSLEHLFVLISFGDLLGVPILPPYYSLRLLPYVVPLINNWRRRMLRERDLLDSMF
jgi:hypothetical protein